MRPTRLFSRPSIRLTLIALLAPLVTGPTATAEPTSPASTQSVLQCAASVPIYAVRDNGELWLHQHLEPENGLNSWGTARRIGAGWNIGKSFAGPNGVIYLATQDGNLRRYRWNGTGWDTFPGGAQHEVIDTNPLWARYATDSLYRGRITADANGHIYTIEPDGNIHWRAYNPTTRTWAHRVVDGGWDWAFQIVAAGDGVLYTLGDERPPPPPGTIRQQISRLFRFHYHAASQRVLQERTSAGLSISNGILIPRLLSPGGDILYGVRSQGSLTNPDKDLVWYKYDPDAEALSSNVVSVGGWHGQINTFAAPDACQRAGIVMPSRPQVTPYPHAPVKLTRSSNGHVHYSYVDSEGRAAYADADLTSGSIGVAVVPGFTGVTGITSTGENQDGRIQIVGLGLDAEIRNNIKTEVGGPWAGTTTLAGFVVNPAALLRLPDNTLVAYAVDESGDLWFRKQTGVNGPWAAWRLERDFTTNLLADRPLTVVPTTEGGRFIGQTRDGHVRTATIRSDGSTTGWWILGGGTPGFLPGISGVMMPDNTLKIFATWHNGVVYTMRETPTGWAESTWTTIPGVTASGRPSAIMAPEGTLQIVVRGTDGYVYYTGQPAPGSPAFNPWREVTNFTEQSSTDPTALDVPESNTWVIAYRTDLEVPRLLRYVPSASGADTESRSGAEFVKLPMTPPAA